MGPSTDCSASRLWGGTRADPARPASSAVLDTYASSTRTQRDRWPSTARRPGPARPVGNQPATGDNRAPAQRGAVWRTFLANSRGTGRLERTFDSVADGAD